MICLLSAARNDRFDFYQSPVATANRQVRQGRKKIDNGHSHHEVAKSTKLRDSKVSISDSFVSFVRFVEIAAGVKMRLPRPSPPNVLIGGPVRISPGFPPKDGCAEGRIRPKPCGESVQSLVADPLKACGNDGLVGELGVEGHTPFSFSVGERKIMNHFVVKSYCLSIQQPKIVAPKHFPARENFQP
jgi:hypothetical protein